MQSIILQIVGLLIITTLILLFVSKPNVNNFETKTYSKLIGLNFLFIVIGVATYIVAKLIGNIVYIGILQKIYMSILVLLNMYSMFYCISIYDKEHKYDLFKRIIGVITIIAIALIIILPLIVINEGDLLDGIGPSYDVTIAHTILSFLFFFLLTINLFTRKQSIKKALPFLILIILYIVGFVIREFYKELIFEGFFYSYMLFIMYNTIENPDVKMAKELFFQKKLADTSSKKTLELLDEMSSDLKTSLKQLETIGNKKIDKNNIEELKNELNNFQNDSIKLSDKILGIIDLARVKGNLTIREYKYETMDMIDRLKQLLLIDKSLNRNKLKIKVENKMPSVLYGDENNVIKIVLYFYSYILTITDSKKILLNIDSIEVGRFSKLKFNFIINGVIMQNIIRQDNKTDKLEIANFGNINYQIIDNLLKKCNGNISIIKDNDNTKMSLSVNQRILTEYDIISSRDENKDIKINYKDFSGKRILIVEDNNFKIKEMRILLEKYNVDIVSVNSLSEMGEELESNQIFDLILVDDIISNIESDDYTKKFIKNKNNILHSIKISAKYPIIIVIIVTQNSEKKEKKYLEYGFNDYIIKPVNKGNLDRILNKYF